MLTRCKACRGGKEVNGMGGLRVKCTACNGIGWITIKEAIDSTAKTDDDNKSTEIKGHKHDDRRR